MNTAKLLKQHQSIIQTEWWALHEKFILNKINHITDMLIKQELSPDGRDLRDMLVRFQGEIKGLKKSTKIAEEIYKFLKSGTSAKESD